MNTGALTLAFSAGALAAFNPCGFALLPTWAAVLVAGDGGKDVLARLLRALWASIVATAAFLAVFGLAGVVVSAGFAVLNTYLPWIGLVIGGVLAALGALLLVRGHAPGFRLSWHAKQGSSVRAVFGFGVAYALTSLSCVLPVFLLTLGVAAGEPTGTQVASFIGFALGMGTVLALIAVVAALAGQTIVRVRRFGRFVPRLAGALVVAAAVLIVERELGLALLSLGRSEPSLAIRLIISLVATMIIALAALLVRPGRRATAPARPKSGPSVSC